MSLSAVQLAMHTSLAVQHTNTYSHDDFMRLKEPCGSELKGTWATGVSWSCLSTVTLR